MAYIMHMDQSQPIHLHGKPSPSGAASNAVASCGHGCACDADPAAGLTDLPGTPKGSPDHTSETVPSPATSAAPGIFHFLKTSEWAGPSGSAALLLVGLLLEYALGAETIKTLGFPAPHELLAFIYLSAWLPVGWPVFRQALTKVREGDIFTEFLLMSLASFGAFYIGEFPEAVAVMLFYAIGELFQGAAVRRARSNIRALLDVRPTTARVVQNGLHHAGKDGRQVAANATSAAKTTSATSAGDHTHIVHPQHVQPGQILRVLAGERIPLDGHLLSPTAVVDAAALTGESLPVTLSTGETLLSGMINAGPVIDLRVTRGFTDSAISRILQLVQDATARKARTELFIRRFARVYTPIVTLLAALVITLPALWVADYNFNDWLYRGLVFLVISCPCALVISIPLGYFGGIGAASRNGILVKGGNHLDALRQVNTIVFDKTGTLTKGTFAVTAALDAHGKPLDPAQLSAVPWFAALVGLEQHTTHPVARAITSHATTLGTPAAPVHSADEVAGKGLRGIFDDQPMLAGSLNWLAQQGTPAPAIRDDAYPGSTVVAVSIGGQFAGAVLLADVVKPGIAETIAELRRDGIRRILMLTGDRMASAGEIARQAGITEFEAELLPGEKSAVIERLKADPTAVVAFVGDGINDAPSLALADVGVAMGGLGSDAAIETADVVLQQDHPRSLLHGRRISRHTRNVVWQNIVLALGVKVLVMTLGALGMATLWEAVFADVGVALLAVLNAMRIR
jgi:Zn2+/Cd2+-exporting ATPase